MNIKISKPEEKSDFSFFVRNLFNFSVKSSSTAVVGEKVANDSKQKEENSSTLTKANNDE